MARAPGEQQSWLWHLCSMRGRPPPSDTPKWTPDLTPQNGPPTARRHATWTVAQVVLMGDFDGWTRGRELSAEDVTSDSVYARFECELRLRPGRYMVKLLVRGPGRVGYNFRLTGV